MCKHFLAPSVYNQNESHRLVERELAQNTHGTIHVEFKIRQN